LTGLDPAIWVKRYEEALEPGVIKLRGESRSRPVQSHMTMDVEAACKALKEGMEEVVLVTVQIERIAITLIRRALAHAKAVYKDPRTVLMAAYEGVAIEDFVMPMFLTGLAGVGKSRLRVVLRRVLSGRAMIQLDASHPAVPLIDFIDGNIGRKASPSAVVKSLVEDVLGAGGWGSKGGSVEEGARVIRLSGACLLGVDETQFMAQSAKASTLITRTLLMLGELQVPWLVTGNYSLAWKLRKRPSEALQRLLGDPVVMLPDSPGSVDWAELLKEYQVVLRDVLDFQLLAYRVELWNLCAGLKRELVKLLVLSYRTSRLAGATKVSWSHVGRAFASVQFCVSRDDISTLISHAGQGGKLRADLLCPFDGPEISAGVNDYSDKLRQARSAEVAKATVRASMNLQERAAFEAIEQASRPAPAPEPLAQVIKMPKRRAPRTLENMQDAAHDFLASLAADSPVKS